MNVLMINAIKVEQSGTANLMKRQLSGDGTNYDLTVGKTACGGQYSNSDYIAAFPRSTFQVTANPNNSPTCGKCILVSGTKGSHVATIEDICDGCKGDDVDMSPVLFEATVGELGLGRKTVSWKYVDCATGTSSTPATVSTGSNSTSSVNNQSYDTGASGSVTEAQTVKNFAKDQVNKPGINSSDYQSWYQGIATWVHSWFH